MEFDKNSLTKEELKEALDTLKSAIVHYKKKFRNTKLQFKCIYNTTITFEEYVVPHLLGIDKPIIYTWYDYITSKNFSTIENLQKLSDSYEFLYYQIFIKHEDPILNYKKLLYKSTKFQLLNNDELDYFLIEPYKKKEPLKLAKIVDKEIITLKLKSIKNGCIYIPISLYIYQNNEQTQKLLNEIIIPDNLKIYKNKNKKTQMTTCDIEEEKIKQKIKEFLL